jgi:hypothetical protein
MAPFLVGVLAASVWLRRRHAARRVLAAGTRMRQITAAPAPDAAQSEAGQALKGTGIEPAAAPGAPQSETAQALKGTGIEPAAAPGAPQSETAQAMKGPQVEPARRFEREPIDIVTVVDDLLLAGR